MADQPPDDNWRTPDFRRKVIAQLDDTINMSGNPMARSSAQMETHVYQKAKNREEYLTLVARLIIHVRELGSKKEQGGMGQPQQGGGAAGGAMLNDPIHALQSLTRTPNPNMQGAQPNMPAQMMGGQMGGMPQRPPFQTYQQQPGGLPGQPGVMAPGQQGGIPGQPPAGMPGQPGLVRQRMPGMQGGPQDPFLMQQQQQQQQHMMQQQLLQQQQMQQQMQQNMAMGGPPGMQAVRQPVNAQFNNPPQPMGFQPQASTAGPMGNQVNLTSGAPSPASIPVSSYGTLASPATAMLPSPGQGSVAPSPAGKAGAPSPSGIPLNTPGNPQSTGPAPSPQAAQTNAEEQAYLDKLKQLRKYIEPLKRMVTKIEKEEALEPESCPEATSHSEHTVLVAGDLAQEWLINIKRKGDLSKMKNLLNILSDSNRRLPFVTLLKCEQALERLDFQWGKGSTLSVGQVTKADQQHMCQPLIDAVATHIQHPMLNHTLNRTFGPAIQALHGSPITVEDPPAKRKRTDEESDGQENKRPRIPNVVQGEIARLRERRFRVTLDPTHAAGSRTIHVVCRLEDRRVPAVPPLHVAIPEDYPDTSPTCDTDADEYKATEFLEAVQKHLASLILNLPDKYSISTLLNMWELSIRKQCEPKPL